MARGKTRPVIPPMEKMVTRNRGQRLSVIPTVDPKRASSGTPSSVKKINKNNGYTKKKPWEESEDELDYKAEILSASDEEAEVDEEPDEYLPDDSFEQDEEYPIAEISRYADDEDTIVCPWAEDEKYDILLLPNGSKDLFFPPGTLLDLIQIYETVVNYHRVIQISPFLFEDFVAAMRSPEQTILIGDIHIALIKCLLRDDDENQTQYAVTETSVSFQLVCQLMDPTTYAEVLRQYIDSDPRFPKEILDIVANNYPFVIVEDRIRVLQWLCAQFFETSGFLKAIKMDGKIQHNEHCRECGKSGGEMMHCRGCEAVYHPVCNPDAEKTQWFCVICDLHSISGVSDSLYPGEKFGRPALRRSPLGYDREGRIYWLLVRRIIVEDVRNNTVQFYSTLPAIFDLVSALDPERFEARLCKNIYKLLPVIESHCRVTQDLIDNRRHQKVDSQQLATESYLDCENFFRMSYITWNVLNSQQKFLDIDDSNEDVPNSQIPNRLKYKMLNLLGFEHGKLAGVYWTGGRGVEELFEYRGMFVKELALDAGTSFIPMNNIFIEDVKNTFRLGLSDQSFKDFENLYEKNEYAKNPVQRGKERDRKKYMNTRFLVDEPFQWKASKGRTIHDVEPLVLKFLKVTLRHFIEKIPVELFHREWPIYKPQILEQLTLSSRDNTFQEIAQILLQFEVALRKPLFMNAWWNSLGHIRLYRYTSTDRELKQQADKQKAKDDRDLIMADSNDPEIVWVHQTKNKAASKTLFRIKGEQYRMNGRGHLGGWEWVSSAYTRDLRCPEKPPLGIFYGSPASAVTTDAAKRAYRLDKVAKKLMCWRESQVDESKALKEIRYRCYSPYCGKTTASVDGKLLKCYSCQCPSVLGKKMSPDVPAANTPGIAKAFDPVRRRMFVAKQQSKCFENTQGLGIPFPFPRPYDYKHPRNGQKHLFVLPKFYVRKMAKAAGSTLVPLPGFNRNTKTNLAVWNYPCPRPVFDNCWRFMTQCVSSVHSLALQMRILFCGIRWTDMEPNWYDTNDFRFLIPYTEYNELRSVISHQEFPPDGYYERYKLRVELFAEDDDGIPESAPGDVVIRKEETPAIPLPLKPVKPTRKSDRRRSKKNNIALTLRSDTQRKIVERWIDGVDLKVFEIQRYWKCVRENKVELDLPARRLIEPARVRASLPIANNNIKTEMGLVNSKKRPTIKKEIDKSEPAAKRQSMMNAQPVPKRVSLPIIRHNIGSTPSYIKYPNQPYNPQTVFMIRRPENGGKIVRILPTGVNNTPGFAAPQRFGFERPRIIRPIMRIPMRSPIIRMPVRQMSQPFHRQVFTYSSQPPPVNHIRQQFQNGITGYNQNNGNHQNSQ